MCNLYQGVCAVDTWYVFSVLQVMCAKDTWYVFSGVQGMYTEVYMVCDEIHMRLCDEKYPKFHYTVP